MAHGRRTISKKIPQLRNMNPKDSEHGSQEPQRCPKHYKNTARNFPTSEKAIFIREIPPGLLQHVLTVLVFWSWVLLLSRLPPWSRSLRLFAWASILLYGPLDIAWICCPQLPTTRAKTGRTAHVFKAQGGTRRFHQFQNSVPKAWESITGRMPRGHRHAHWLAKRCPIRQVRNMVASGLPPGVIGTQAPESGYHADCASTETFHS